jgi:peptidoglycan/LPS O-acetylase OafA/YrhL
LGSRHTPRTLGETIVSSDNNFNLIRLVAAAAVVFGHSFWISRSHKGFADPMMSAFPFRELSGNLGVHAFFLISGILIAQSWCRTEKPVQFVTQRVARIFAALIVCLVFTAYVVGALGTTAPLRNYFASKPVHDYVLNNLWLTNVQWNIPTVFADGPYVQSMNGSLWSLVIEIRMYILVLVFGVLGLIGAQKRMATAATAAVLIALFLLYRPLFGHHLSTITDGIVPVFYFLGGVFVYAIRDVVAVRPTHVLLLLGAVFLAPAPAAHIVFHFFFGALVLWAGGLRSLADWVKIRNDFSYGIFLYGFPVQQLLALRFPGLNPYGLFVVAMAVVTVLAALSWFLIERPLLRAPRLIFGTGRKLAGDDQVGQGAARRHAAAALIAVLLCVAVPFGASKVAESRQRARVDAPNFNIVKYGPTATPRGAAFNVQPDGRSAIWVEVDAPVDPSAYVVLDGRKLESSPGKMGISAFVPAEMLKEPGVLKLSVEWFEVGRFMKSNTVDVVVH